MREKPNKPSKRAPGVFKASQFNTTMSNTVKTAINPQANEDDEPDDWYVMARSQKFGQEYLTEKLGTSGSSAPAALVSFPG